MMLLLQREGTCITCIKHPFISSELYSISKFYITFDINLLLNKHDNSSKTDVKDVHGRQVPFYTDVPRILQNLNNDGIKVGVASRYVLN